MPQYNLHKLILSLTTEVQDDTPVNLKYRRKDKWS